MDTTRRMRAAPFAATVVTLATLAACGGGGGDGGSEDGTGGGTSNAPEISASLDGALVELRSRINRCFAVPVAQRDDAAACDEIPVADDYLINGRDDEAHYGPLLDNPATLNNDIGPIRVERQLDENAAVVVMQWTDGAGFRQQYADILRNFAPAGQPARWRLAGNGRPYDFTVRYRMERRIAVNPATAANLENPGIRAGLAINWNPSGPNSNDIRVVRVKGPGINPAGVVLARGRVCGSDTYAPIANDTGNTGAAAFQFTQGTSGSYHASSANTDPTRPYTWLPGSASYLDVPLADPASIPRFADYTFEVFRFGSANPAQPDETVVVPLSGRPISFAEFAAQPAPTLAPATISSFLTPGGAQSAALANAPIQWTSNGASVSGVLLFGQRFVNGVVSPAVNTFTPVPLAATSVNVPTANLPPGTRTSNRIDPATTSDVCASSLMPALDGTNATYRQASVRVRSDDRNDLVYTWFWQNP